jgi:hypothetical protein
MARKVTQYTVTEEGRDKGKVFMLTEMAASKAEAWAARALLALLAGNVQLPAGIERLGFAGLAQVGIRALGGLRWEAAAPLLAEMMDCVQCMPDPSNPNVMRALIETDIEEIMTRINIRQALWELHTDFLKTAAAPISA